MQVTQSLYFPNLNYRNSYSKEKVSFKSTNGEGLKEACAIYLKILELRPAENYSPPQITKMFDTIQSFKKIPSTFKKTAPELLRQDPDLFEKEPHLTKFLKTILVLSGDSKDKSLINIIKEYPYNQDKILKFYDGKDLFGANYKEIIKKFSESKSYEEIQPRIKENPALTFEALISDALNGIQDKLIQFTLKKDVDLPPDEYKALISVISSGVQNKSISFTPSDTKKYEAFMSDVLDEIQNKSTLFTLNNSKMPPDKYKALIFKVLKGIQNKSTQFTLSDVSPDEFKDLSDISSSLSKLQFSLDAPKFRGKYLAIKEQLGVLKAQVNDRQQTYYNQIIK